MGCPGRLYCRPTHGTFQENLDGICNRDIPRRRLNGRKKNLYMTREALALQNRKKRMWKTYMRTNDSIDYYWYCHTRAQLRKLTRRLHRNFEHQLAENLKENRKAFWRYVHSCMTTRTRLDDLVTEDGAVASSDEAKVRTMAGAYSRVFCWDEDPADVPTLNHQYEGPLLKELQVTAEQVEGRLCNLRPTASPEGRSVPAYEVYGVYA